MENSIKNIVLAGIGGIAYTYEKSMAMAEELVKKGELTIGLGKQLNSELKRSVKTESDLTKETVNQLKEILADLNLATKDDIDLLNERIDGLENK